MHTVHDPAVPCVIPIHEELCHGAKIDIHAHKKHDDCFAIELLSGPNIVLHLSFRFEHGEHQLVMNSFAGGQWGIEERVHNPIGHGHHSFKIHIHVHEGHYDIHVNGDHVGKFHHRFPVQAVQAVGVKGCVHVEKIKFEGFHFQKSWDQDYSFGHAGYNAYGTDSYDAPHFQEGHGYNAYFN